MLNGAEIGFLGRAFRGLEETASGVELARRASKRRR